MNNTFLLFYSPKPWSQVCIKVKFMQKRLIIKHKRPSKCDHFGRHGTQNFRAGDLICKKVFLLNQKSWLPTGNQAKTLTWRVDKYQIKVVWPPLKLESVFQPENSA